MGGSGFKKVFVCVKTAFLSRFQVLKVAPVQFKRARAATLLIVNWETLESLVMWGYRAEKCCFARRYLTPLPDETQLPKGPVATPRVDALHDVIQANHV